MNSTSIAVALTLGVLLATPASGLAQETKTARGTVVTVADDALTIKVQGQEMKFSVDSKTTVEVVGGSTRTRQAQQAGQPGPKLTEVLKTGQPVTVGYTEASGAMRAASIRAISSLGRAAAEGGGANAAAAPKSMTGLVTMVNASSLAIMGSGGASSTFTFSVDGNTKVIGVGAGTATAAAGGKTAFTDLVHRGDRVSVSYQSVGSTLHAAEIRVTAKGGAK